MAEVFNDPTALTGTGWWGGHIDADTIKEEITDPGNAAFDALADSGVVATGGAVTLAAGWGSLSFKYHILGGWVFLIINATRTGSTLTASSSGGLADTDVATVIAPIIPGDSNVYQTFVGANMSGACVLDTTGKFTLLSADPTSTISSDDVVHATFQYPAA